MSPPGTRGDALEKGTEEKRLLEKAELPEQSVQEIPPGS
jgi:hypothetical protein